MTAPDTQLVAVWDRHVRAAAWRDWCWGNFVREISFVTAGYSCDNTIARNVREQLGLAGDRPGFWIERGPPRICERICRDATKSGVFSSCAGAPEPGSPNVHDYCER